MATESFDVLYHDGQYWQVVQPLIIGRSKATEIALEAAINYDSRIVKIVDEIGDLVCAYKYCKYVMYRQSDRGWVING